MSFLGNLFDALSYIIFYGIDDDETIETMYTQSDKLSYDSEVDSDVDDEPNYSNFIDYSIQSKATRRNIAFC
jgi:hypothetical protein